MTSSDTFLYNKVMHIQPFHLVYLQDGLVTSSDITTLSLAPILLSTYSSQPLFWIN